MVLNRKGITYLFYRVKKHYFFSQFFFTRPLERPTGEKMGLISHPTRHLEKPLKNWWINRTVGSTTLNLYGEWFYHVERVLTTVAVVWLVVVAPGKSSLPAGCEGGNNCSSDRS